MSRSMQRPRSARWVTACGVALVIAATCLIPVASVSATAAGDVVLEWNQNAVAALSNAASATPPGAAQTPPVASIHLAMVQGAVYDAVNSIQRGYKPYLHGLPKAPKTASKRAAAATAAHHVLVGLLPALPAPVITDLNTRYAASLALITDGQSKTDGINAGEAAAAAMLKARAHDGRYGTFTFTSGTHPGEWRPVLPAFVSDPFAWVAKVKPFTLKRRSQFRTDGPLPMTSQRYVSEFNEVKAFGAATGSARNAHQTETALFFSANPLPMQNKTLRDVAHEEDLSAAQAARLFALSSMAAADALINCWDDKAHWNFWRPITAIREAASDGNPSTEPQDDWLPFIATGTPPYPDHPSGYNCFTGAMMSTAASYFKGDDVTIQLTSPITATTRTYDKFTDVLVDTIDARVYLGIHFRTPDIQGARLGKQVANWVADHNFGRANH
jgi:PAP2 superfamily